VEVSDRLTLWLRLGLQIGLVLGLGLGLWLVIVFMRRGAKTEETQWFQSIRGASPNLPKRFATFLTVL